MKGKVLIVEDQLIIAENLKDIVEGLGYSVVELAINADEAIQFIEEHRPDIVLLDVVIQGKIDGIDLANIIRKKYFIPFIFITAFSDKITLDRAKETMPYGYIVKPFKEQDINPILEVALANYKAHSIFNSSSLKEEVEEVNSDCLFIRDKGLLLKIRFKEILWVEADGNYTLIHTKTTKFALRTCMGDLEEKLPAKQFMRVHKSYIINLEELSAMNSHAVYIGKNEIPIGRTYYNILINQLNIFSSR